MRRLAIAFVIVAVVVAAFGAGFDLTSSGIIGVDSADASCCWTWEWPED